MNAMFTTGVGLMLASAALVAATPAKSAIPTKGSFPVVELRQYTLHDGQRDVLIDLFEREFIESQEALGVKVIGTFRDLDRPNRLVWLRGFPNMETRGTALNAFYFGPVWKAHREAANATMVDSDNVLLLHAPSETAGFALPAARPGLGEQAPSGLVVATIHYLKVDPTEALRTFEADVRPALEAGGIKPLAWFVPESAANNFPALPVREGEKVLVWFAAFQNVADHQAHAAAIDQAAARLAPLLARETEVLRLKPTSRSLVRGIPGSALPTGGEQDFDFLHGRWNVHHRLLKARGVGSTEWVEYEGTADTRPLLGGLCNVEEHRITGRGSGVALRCFDRAAKRWAIYWVSDRDGALGKPVYGGFNGSEGLFEGDDSEGSRSIITRFNWRKITDNSARWQQSSSYDGGKTWEPNWIMQFERQRQSAKSRRSRR